jgi:hypothetical protein
LKNFNAEVAKITQRTRRKIQSFNAKIAKDPKCTL